MERQLNLLGNSNTIPHISTYTHLYGHHNYNAKPFIPIGMEALTHDKPHHRKTFAQHCSKGWVLGMSPEHYRCWTIWSKDTRATRVTGRVLSKHKYLTNPHVTPEDQVMAAAANLATVLTTNKNTNQISHQKYKDLQRLQQILHKTAADPRVNQDELPDLSQDLDSDSKEEEEEEEETPSPRVAAKGPAQHKIV